MTKIKKLIKEIDEEIEGAKCYIEMSLDYKVNGNAKWANRFKEMATDELKHADYLHELVAEEITLFSKIYTPPTEMQDKWNESHAKYVERVAWIKQMMSL